MKKLHHPVEMSLPLEGSELKLFIIIIMTTNFIPLISLTDSLSLSASSTMMSITWTEWILQIPMAAFLLCPVCCSALFTAENHPLSLVTLHHAISYTHTHTHQHQHTDIITRLNGEGGKTGAIKGSASSAEPLGNIWIQIWHQCPQAWWRVFVQGFLGSHFFSVGRLIAWFPV